MTQIALPLEARSDTAPVRLALDGSYRTVLDALADTARWPFRTALLVAPHRAGKSLLAARFRVGHAGMAIDDADRADETELFHAWNRAQETGQPLLLTARPGWRVALPDLASRLGGSLHLAVGPPDDAMMADLIAAHAEQRRLWLDDGAATYLVPRLERSHAAAEAIVATIDRLSLERQAPATISIWRDALEALQGPDQGRLL